MSQIKRNDPCTCGSGKKYKNCCGKIEAKLTQKRHEGLKARTVTSSTTPSPLVSFAKRAFKVIKDAGDSPALSEHHFTQGAIEKLTDEKSLEKMIGLDEK